MRAGNQLRGVRCVCGVQNRAASLEARFHIVLGTTDHKPGPASQAHCDPKPDEGNRSLFEGSVHGMERRGYPLALQNTQGIEHICIPAEFFATQPFEERRVRVGKKHPIQHMVAPNRHTFVQRFLHLGNAAGKEDEVVARLNEIGLKNGYLGLLHEGIKCSKASGDRAQFEQGKGVHLRQFGSAQQGCSAARG